MTFFPETNKENFQSKLAVLENALSQRKLISDRLEVVTKGGFRWTMLCLLRPFFSLFGKDLFSHVRVNNVAKGILAYFKANQAFVDEATINQFKAAFLDPFKAKKSYFSLSGDHLVGFLSLPPLKWPTNLAILGITQEQKIALEQALTEVLPKTYGENQPIICVKMKVEGVSIRKLRLYDNYSCDRLKKEVVVPLTVKITIGNPRTSRIDLWTKVVIAKGGQRKVKKCYNLLTGNVFVRKKFCSKLEELILRHFRYNPSRGIEPVEFFEDCAEGFKSKHIIQPCFEGTILNLLSSVHLEPKDVYSIVYQLATGLSALHAFTPTEQSISFNRFFDMRTTTTTYPKTFHLDIKPDNILIRRIPNSDSWEAVLSDFGIAGTLHPGNGTIGYLSPEDVKFKNLLYPNGHNGPISPDISDKEIVATTLAYSQKKDVWALGLVFISLLTNRWTTITRREDGQIKSIIAAPPLECILAALEKGEEGKHIADITQDSVDQSIAELRAATPVYASLWDNLIFKMLQVDPMQRISAEEVIKICSAHKFEM
jgi:hypothetical protein